MTKRGQIRRIRRLSRLQGLHSRDVLPPGSPALLPKPPVRRDPGSDQGKDR